MGPDAGRARAERNEARRSSVTVVREANMTKLSITHVGLAGLIRTAVLVGLGAIWLLSA